MGQRGPVPRRSSERRRRNKDSKTQKVKAAPAASSRTRKPAARVRRPAVSKHWHPIAKSWFTSLGESGQAQFYEPSDWQAARYVAEVMSKQLKAAKPSAQMFAALWSAMTDLLTTEGARRRVRLEIEREVDPDKVPAGVTALDEYRKSLGA